MGKFNIPRIARPVDLARYAPELAEEIAKAPPPIYMWVNLTRGARSQYAEIRRDSRQVLAALTAAGEADKEKIDEAKVAIQDLSRQAEALNRRMAAWWAEAWSQGPDMARWSIEEVEHFLIECSEQDPALWEFIINECWRMVSEHRESARKN
jgi:outer membrane murein-binding lipoprotein Lpp